MVWSADTYTKAWNFASRAHKSQLVPGSDIPYLNHIGNVAQEVLLAITVEPVKHPDLCVQCALLHDCIEDTPVSYEALVEAFGTKVADGVSALSKRPEIEDKIERMKDSLVRIQAMPHEVWIVKMADRISNLQMPPDYWSKEKINSYMHEATTILEALAGAHQYLSNRLKHKISHYERFFC